MPIAITSTTPNLITSRFFKKDHILIAMIAVIGLLGFFHTLNSEVFTKEQFSQHSIY